MDRMKLEDVIQTNIISILNLGDRPEEEQAEIIQKAYETIMNRVMLRIADQLSEEEVGQLKELMLSGDGTAVNEFLVARGVDLDQLATAETLSYKTEMVALMESLSAANS